MDYSHTSDDQTRRSFLRKAGYLAPAVLTLRAVPAFASHNSSKGDEGGEDGHVDEHDTEQELLDGIENAIRSLRRQPEIRRNRQHA